MNVRVADAVYTESRLKELQGNPLSEAIPPRLNEEAFLERIIRLPEFSDAERNWDDFEREMCVKRLERCLIPTSIYFHFYKQLYLSLYSGYISKNPLLPKTIEWLYDRDNTACLDDKTTADTMLLHGLSGLGKSTMLEHTLYLIPQVIQHTSYKRKTFRETQILYVKFSIPPDGERKGLLLSFFRAIDSIVGTKYFTQYCGINVSIDSMRAGVDIVCKKYWIGLIIIDELQNLNIASSAVKTKILQLFDEISNLTKVPIIKIGTNDSLLLFSGKFTSSRRADSAGSIEMKRYERNDTDWGNMCDVAWVRQWIKKPTPMTEEIRDLIYQLTQGIPSCLFRLFTLANIEAIASGTEKIDKSLLIDIYKKQFGLIRHALTALSKNRTSMYDDLASASDWFDTGGDRGSITKLLKLVAANEIRGDAAVDILNEVNSAVLNFYLSDRDRKKLTKIKAQLEDCVQAKDKQKILNKDSNS